jgi:methylphosphotriester-DNA--protein-cysteine methyltransferase
MKHLPLVRNLTAKLAKAMEALWLMELAARLLNSPRHHRRD